jgi:hypothetical protein
MVLRQKKKKAVVEEEEEEEAVAMEEEEEAPPGKKKKRKLSEAEEVGIESVNSSGSGHEGALRGCHTWASRRHAP